MAAKDRKAPKKAGALGSILLAATLCAFASAANAQPSRDEPGEPVVLLHALALNATTMKKLASEIREAGFRTCRINYPSRLHPIEVLAARHVLPRIRRCFPNDTMPIHFVTHSLGGIVARRLEKLEGAPRIGRVVMIAPPNKGSEVVDSLARTRFLRLWGGPAAHELGTDSLSMPNQLGPPAFEFGVIAATRSIEPWFSSMIPGRDDGKVSVENTKLEGMSDFVTIPSTHTLVLWTDEAARQTVHFLKNGAFAHGP